MLKNTGMLVWDSFYAKDGKGLVPICKIGTVAIAKPCTAWWLLVNKGLRKGRSRQAPNKKPENNILGLSFIKVLSLFTLNFLLLKNLLYSRHMLQ